MYLIRQKKHGFLFGLKQKTSGISYNHLCQTCVFKSIRKKLSAFFKCGMAHLKKKLCFDIEELSRYGESRYAQTGSTHRHKRDVFNLFGLNGRFVGQDTTKPCLVDGP